MSSDTDARVCPPLNSALVSFSCVHHRTTAPQKEILLGTPVNAASTARPQAKHRNSIAGKVLRPLRDRLRDKPITVDAGQSADDVNTTHLNALSGTVLLIPEKVSCPTASGSCAQIAPTSPAPNRAAATPSSTMRAEWIQGLHRVSRGIGSLRAARTGGWGEAGWSMDRGRPQSTRRRRIVTPLQRKRPFSEHPVLRDPSCHSQQWALSIVLDKWTQC